eukprot:TRINITY_DN63231_c0_g1_i1.p1 TRINITY_DN63231_c0_g1~~TRINITY_DN63231_c0_g1_i1.p1  ORF type:complete len:192 (-),score=22.58 TRINITY_DN63231_c0_g1_i1:18-593(-)
MPVWESFFKGATRGALGQLAMPVEHTVDDLAEGRYITAGRRVGKVVRAAVPSLACVDHLISASAEVVDLGEMNLFHRTTIEAGRKIRMSKKMKPGCEGVIGRGVYFAETPQACCKKTRHSGHGQPYAMVEAKVRLGKCRILRDGEREFSMVFGDIRAGTVDSVGSNFNGGWEYCVLDPSRVTVISVTDHRA